VPDLLPEAIEAVGQRGDPGLAVGTRIVGHRDAVEGALCPEQGRSIVSALMLVDLGQFDVSIELTVGGRFFPQR
jgi:hypothetical protein